MKFAPKKYRNEAALAKQVDTFKTQFEAAAKIENPADRLEAMLELQTGVFDHLGNIISDFSGRATAYDAASIVGSIVGVVGAGLGLTILATPLVGLPVLVGGIIGLVIGGVKYDVGDKLMDRMQKEISGHMDALKGLLTKSGSDIDDLLKNRSTEIAASEKLDSLYDNYPGIRDSFIKTFNKAVARGEIPAPPKPEPTAPQQKFSL